MECPVCEKKENFVIDSRYVASHGAIRRRRECSSCKHRYTTYERIEDPSLIYIFKRNEIRREFDRCKLFNSIALACHKRPITNTGIDNITKDIVAKLYELRKDPERPDIKNITTDLIREIVIFYLLKKDLVACIRYASYRYADLSEFYEGIIELKEAHGRI